MFFQDLLNQRLKTDISYDDSDDEDNDTLAMMTSLSLESLDTDDEEELDLENEQLPADPSLKAYGWDIPFNPEIPSKESVYDARAEQFMQEIPFSPLTVNENDTSFQQVSNTSNAVNTKFDTRWIQE